MAEDRAPLSKRLSSTAKREVLIGSQEDPILVLIRVAASLDRDSFRAAITANGGQIISWSEETDLVSARVPRGYLNHLATGEGIIYVDVGGDYRR